VNKAGENIDLTIQGRHDVCLAPRIVPVVEAMAAITLLDLFLQQKAIS
jgi:chorismate synthase